MWFIDDECVWVVLVYFVQQIFGSCDVLCVKVDSCVVGDLVGYQYDVLVVWGVLCGVVMIEVVFGDVQVGDIVMQLVCVGQFGVGEVCGVEDGGQFVWMGCVEVDVVLVDDLVVWCNVIGVEVC